VQAGDTVYIPGGGGGVGHLAVQMAARVLGAGLVISSGSTLQSTALARQSGAHYVFDYKPSSDPTRRAVLLLVASQAIEFLEFEQLTDDTSKLNMHVIYQSVAQRDQALKIGMPQGINMAHNRLQDIVNKLK
jgi:NADPH:quinone reductase-like Zn-dependent oxidoreductase